MQAVRRFLVSIVWLVLCASEVLAQDKVRIEVSVNAASGGSYYLDKGRADGLEAGDQIVISGTDEFKSAQRVILSH